MLFNETIIVYHCLDDRIKQNFTEGVYKFNNRKPRIKLSHLPDINKLFIYDIIMCKNVFMYAFRNRLVF